MDCVLAKYVNVLSKLLPSSTKVLELHSKVPTYLISHIFLLLVMSPLIHRAGSLAVRQESETEMC